MAVVESITEARAVTYTDGEHVLPVAQRGLLFAQVGGSVQVEWPSGVQSTITVEDSGYIRWYPKRIIEAGTTATLQIHI